MRETGLCCGGRRSDGSGQSATGSDPTPSVILGGGSGCGAGAGIFLSSEAAGESGSAASSQR